MNGEENTNLTAVNINGVTVTKNDGLILLGSTSKTTNTDNSNCDLSKNSMGKVDWNDVATLQKLLLRKDEEITWLRNGVNRK